MMTISTFSLSWSPPHQNKVHMIWHKHFQLHLACPSPLEIIHVLLSASDPGLLSSFVLSV